MAEENIYANIINIALHYNPGIGSNATHFDYVTMSMSKFKMYTTLRKNFKNHQSKQ